MKKSLIITMVVCGVLAFGIQAHALFISPGGQTYDGVTNPTASPPSSQDNINAVILPLMGNVEELTFSFTPNADESGGTISNIIGVPDWLLVKDGNHSPYWYLFSVPELGGNDNIILSGFWVEQGAISHVNLYGAAPVPEPSTILLLGAGLVGLAFYGRRRTKA
ncbi:MAG TPA: PEP-CTERM sorting domain-containing protein [Desulfuromonadales bacterium]|nr:PEP-CTERM sorting domain-containing protein [Desulfuromonadales bacterium]